MSSTPFPDWMVLDSNDGWGEVEELPGYSFYNNTIKLYFDPGPHVYYRFSEDGERQDVAGVTTVLDVINKPFLKVWAAKVAIEYVQKDMLLPDGSFKPYSTEEFLAMLQTAKSQHKIRLDIAGDIGHIAHDILEKNVQWAITHNKGVVDSIKFLPTEGTPEINNQAINCANAAFGWMVAHDVVWLATEKKIYSREFDFAGTLDGKALVSNCSDLKCCKGRVFKHRLCIIDFKSSNQLSDSYALQTAAYQFAEIEENGETITDRWLLRLGKEAGDFEPWFLPADEFEADFEAFLAALTLRRGLDEIEERRKRDRAHIREILKAIRAKEKAEREAIEKEERLKVKIAKMAETKRRNDEAKALYKKLRAEGKSKTDAELIAYPNKGKGRSKADETDSVESADSAQEPPDTVTEEIDYSWSIQL